MEKLVVIFMTGFLFVVFFAGQISAAEQTEDAVQVVEKYYKKFLFKEISELKYPQVKEMDDRAFQRNINKDFKNYIKQSYQAFQETKELAEQQGFEADYQSDFDVKYNKDTKLSILTEDYRFAGGAHGSTEVKSFNYDLTSKQRLLLTDILTTEQQMEMVKHYVWRYASDRPEIFFPDLKQEDIQLSKDTAFYFTDKGITLVFQQYELAPYVAGNPEIEVPSDVYQVE